VWVLAATASASPQRDPIQLAPDAPDRYTVVRGDTLWDISGRFLRSPWRWPEVWQLNRTQIANPHLIYPGDTIFLDRSGPEPRLLLNRPIGEPGAQLQPQIRVESEDQVALTTVDLSAIQVFLNRPLIVQQAELARHPRIIGTQDNRVYLSRGDLAYVRGTIDEKVREWHIYRPARPLTDPKTRQTLAWETLYVGTARLERTGDPATYRIESNTEEISEGDRLMPAQNSPVPRVAPHAPEQAIDARIVSVYRGVDQVGKLGVVAISGGTRDGLELGHVLRVETPGREVIDRETQERVQLPSEPLGQLLLFRVFDRIAYGLVVSAAGPVSLGARVTNP